MAKTARELNSDRFYEILTKGHRARAQVRFSGKNVEGKIGRLANVRRLPVRFIKIRTDEPLKARPFTPLRMAFHLETQAYVVEATVMICFGRTLYLSFPQKLSLMDRRKDPRIPVPKGKLSFRPIAETWDEHLEVGRNDKLEAIVQTIGKHGLGVVYENIKKTFVPVVGDCISQVKLRFEGKPYVFDGNFEIRNILIEESQTVRRDGTRRRSCRLGLQVKIDDPAHLEAFAMLIDAAKPQDSKEMLLSPRP